MSQFNMDTYNIDTLRRAVKLFNNCSEDFNHRFSPEELLKIFIAYRRCAWDIPPDQWTDWQIGFVIRYSLTPIFDEDMSPIKPTIDDLLEDLTYF